MNFIDFSAYIYSPDFSNGSPSVITKIEAKGLLTLSIYIPVIHSMCSCNKAGDLNWNVSRLPTECSDSRLSAINVSKSCA